MEWKEIDAEAKGRPIEKVGPRGVLYKSWYAPQVLLWWKDKAFLTQWIAEEGRWNGFSLKDSPTYYALVSAPFAATAD